MWLRTSLIVCIPILFAIVIWLIAGNHLPKKLFLLIWKIVILRLLLPISIPINLWSINIKRPVWKDLVHIPNTLLNNSENTDLAKQILTVQNLNMTRTNIDTILPIIIWLSITGIMLVVMTVQYYLASREIKESIPIREFKVLRLWRSSTNPNNTIPVRISRKIKTPITYGFIKPKILFPKFMESMNEKQLYIILMHEWVHIRHRDNLWKMLMLVTIAVYWFNPLVWILFHLFSRDLETACDEEVLELLGEHRRQDYAMTLIKMAATGSALHLGNGFSRNSIKERIVCIMKYKKISGKRKVVSFIILLAILAMTLLTAYGIEDQETDYYKNHPAKVWLGQENYEAKPEVVTHYASFTEGTYYSSYGVYSNLTTEQFEQIAEYIYLQITGKSFKDGGESHDLSGFEGDFSFAFYKEDGEELLDAFYYRDGKRLEPSKYDIFIPAYVRGKVYEVANR